MRHHSLGNYEEEEEIKILYSVIINSDKINKIDAFVPPRSQKKKIHSSSIVVRCFLVMGVVIRFIFYHNYFLRSSSSLLFMLIMAFTLMTTFRIVLPCRVLPCLAIRSPSLMPVFIGPGVTQSVTVTQVETTRLDANTNQAVPP